MLLYIFFLFLAGLSGGFIAGLAGIGGGVVYIFIIPIALGYFGVPAQEVPQFTIANSVFAILFASLAGNIVRIRNKEFLLREVLTVGIFGAVASVLVLEYIVNTRWYSLPVFNMVLLVLLIYLLISTLAGARRNYSFPPDKVKPISLGAVGIAGGGISALSGMGGGVIIIPLLNIIFKVDIKKAGTISLGVISIMAFVMTVFNLFEEPVSGYTGPNVGYILFPVVLGLLPGVLIGSPIGAQLARKMRSSIVSYIYAGFLLVVIVKKLTEILNIYLWESS